MQDDLAAFVLEDAEVHGARVEIDPTVVLMLASVEAHGSPPGFDELFALSSFLPIAGRSRRGLNQYHEVSTRARAAHGPSPSGNPRARTCRKL